MKRILYIISIALLFISFVGCGNSEKENKKAHENETSNIDSSYITISKEQFEEGAMELGVLQEHYFPTMVKTTGMIDVPPQNRAIVSAFSGGYIKNTLLLIGDTVKKGQALLTIESPDFIEIQQEYLETTEQLTYLKSEYDRQKALVAEKITSQKNYLKAESEYKKALAVYHASRKKLTMLNISPSIVEKGIITSVVTLYAPISGSISKVNVTKGMYVSPAHEIIEIMNADHVHLELTVFEKDLMKVEKKQQILFKIPEVSKDTFQAEVYLVGTAIDAKSRTVKVHAHLNDLIKYNFAVGMFVEASIITKNISAKALPKEAVVSIEEKNYVLISAPNTKFRFNKKEVTIGKTDNDFIEIRNAQEFTENHTFLTKGAFNLITE